MLMGPESFRTTMGSIIWDSFRAALWTVVNGMVSLNVAKIGLTDSSSMVSPHQFLREPFVSTSVGCSIAWLKVRPAALTRMRDKLAMSGMAWFLQILLRMGVMGMGRRPQIAGWPAGYGILSVVSWEVLRYI